VPGRPNLLVIVLDSLRHDALAGDDDEGAAAHMPFLDSLAARGVRFENAAAAAPWTLPSLTSLFTGLLPSRHFQCHPEGNWPLPDHVTTFAEILREGYGYETAAFVNGPWYRKRADSLLQGFEHQRVSFGLQGCEEEVGEWNAQRDRSRPFFLCLHTLEPHDPYGERNHPWPPISRRPALLDSRLIGPDIDVSEVVRQTFLTLEVGVALRRRMHPIQLRDLLQGYKFSGYAARPRPGLAQELASAYWEGVRWVDGLLEKAYAQLGAMGLLENTLVVVTSDHGEAFGEHANLGHGLWLYDEVIHIPLVMLGPGPFQGGKVIASEVSLLDTLPTFLDWAGMDPHTGVEGRSALPALAGHDACRPVVSEEPLSRANTGEDLEALRISARSRRWKYIVTLNLRTAEVQEEAYDLTVDPLELDDLAEGTGRLPDGVSLDACMCPVLERVRDRIWRPGQSRDASEEAVVTSPYGAGASVPSRRPEPCRPAD
jgi:arylsulfatase A-like enzyme